MNRNDILKAVMPKNAETVGTGRDDIMGDWFRIPPLWRWILVQGKGFEPSNSYENRP